MNDPHLLRTLMKVGVPLLVIGAVIFKHRLRRLSLADNLGFRKPPAGATLGWVALYTAVMLLSNQFMGWRGPWDFAPWRNDSLTVNILRVLAVGVLGPIAEELVFRGFIYGRLARTRLGERGAIALTALVWGGIHIDYTLGVIALLMVAGVLLGFARCQTRSILTPIIMHVVWNLYAVW